MLVLAVDQHKAAAAVAAAAAAAQSLGSAVAVFVAPSEAGCTKPILKHCLAVVALAGPAVDQSADQIGYKLLAVVAVVAVVFAGSYMDSYSAEKRTDC